MSWEGEALTPHSIFARKTEVVEVWRAGVSNRTNDRTHFAALRFRLMHGQCKAELHVVVC